MAKRKSGGRAANSAAVEPAGYEDRSGARLAMKSWEDVMDSEDEFIAARDKVLLDEGPLRKRARKLQEEEEDLEESGEEVFGLDGEDDSSEEFDEEAYEDIAGDEDEMDIDEEITGRKKSAKDSVGEDDEGWGDDRRDFYGDDEIETEADALAHEAEARRIQQKQLADMKDADFGFGEDEWGTVDAIKKDEEEDDDDRDDEAVMEKLPELAIPQDAGPEDRIKLLRARYPEFEALKTEFLSLQETHATLKANAVSAASHDAASLTIARLKYQALSAYLGTLTMYFALLTSTASTNGESVAKAPTDIHEHDIMAGLVSSREAWLKAKKLKKPKKPKMVQQQKLIIDEPAEIQDQLAKQQIQKKKQKVSKEEAAEIASRMRRAARMAAVDASFADIDSALTSVPSRSVQRSKKTTVAQTASGEDSDFGDDTELDKHEAALKAARSKSLRFYTSQITQRANKRAARGAEIGGDADVPYRETWKERQARQQAEAEKKQELRYGKDDEGNLREKNPNPSTQTMDDDDEYQDLVNRAAALKSAKKRAAAEAFAANAAAKDAEYLEGEEVVGEDGKRKLSYQISANKGLAPRRKKDVRNPRVKKRNKYEEKKKKLSSVRAVYKGGPGARGYQGEATGIKTNLVKGIKL